MNLFVAEPGCKTPDPLAWLEILGPGQTTGLQPCFLPLSAPLRLSFPICVCTAEPGWKSPDATARGYPYAERHSGLLPGAVTTVPERREEQYHGSVDSLLWRAQCARWNGSWQGKAAAPGKDMG